MWFSILLHQAASLLSTWSKRNKLPRSRKSLERLKVEGLSIGSLLSVVGEITIARSVASALKAVTNEQRLAAKAAVFASRNASELKAVYGWGTGLEGVQAARATLDAAAMARIQASLSRAKSKLRVPCIARPRYMEKGAQLQANEQHTWTKSSSFGSRKVHRNLPRCCGNQKRLCKQYAAFFLRCSEPKVVLSPGPFSRLLARTQR